MKFLSPISPISDFYTHSLLRGDVLAVDVEGEGGVLEHLAVEDDDHVVPLALLDQVREPDPGAVLPGEVGLPVARLAEEGLLRGYDERLVPVRCKSW